MKAMISILLVGSRSPAAVASIALLGFATSSCDRGEPARSAPRPRPVKVTELHEPGMAKEVEFPGQIAAVQQSRKAFDVPGRIIAMNVKEGQSIKMGQVLARLDPRDYQSALDSAQARYEMAKTHVNRITPLVDKHAVAQQQLDLARRDLITATANLEQANKALNETIMIADFDGQVAELLVEDFANVKDKQDVMVIQDVSSLEIVIQVPETIVALRMPGETDEEKVANSRPVVIPSALPGEEHQARFDEVSRTPDPVTRTYKLTLAFTPPADTRIRSGMTAKVRATIPASTALKTDGFPIPATAVFSANDGRGQVWTLDRQSMRVSRTEVDLGAILGDRMLVTGGVETGNLIVTSGVHQLRDGQVVRIWNEH